MKRVLLVWFRVALWWVPYRSLDAIQRRRLKVVFSVGYALAAAVSAVDSEPVVATLCALAGAATFAACGMVDLELAKPEPGGRTT